MTFDVAYARYSAVFSDSLRIDISTNCNTTYVPSGYYKGGTDLATVADQTAQWQPASGAEWRKDTVDLSSWTGNNITVKFVNINGYGNSLFIDNINLTDVTGMDENSVANNIYVFPNPSAGLFNIVINSEKSSVYNLELHDMNGRLISSNSIAVNGVYKSQMDLHNFSKGIYSLIVKNENGIYRTRIVIL